MRDRSFESQVYRGSGLNLLIAAIILWNTRYLQAAFVELQQQGVNVTPTIVTHVAPHGWEHIGLTGDYVWTDAGGRTQETEIYARLAARSERRENGTVVLISAACVLRDREKPEFQKYPTLQLVSYA